MTEVPSAMIHAVVAAALNQPIILTRAIDEALDNNVLENELYEAFLQTYLFAGFPAALESLSALATAIRHRHISSNKPLHRPTELYDIEHFSQRGTELCQSIYTTTYQKMRQNLSDISPELSEWMIVEGYGKTLSRDELPIKTRELLIVAVLTALGWGNQLHSHLRGALNVGASAEECRTVIAALDIFPQNFIRLRQEDALRLLTTITSKKSMV